MNYVIMLNEVVKYLNIKPNGLYVDCTFGLGGHTNEILKYLNLNGKIIIIDKEIDSYFLAKNIFIKNKKTHSFLISFNQINLILNKFKNKTDGIIVDLGLSIYQLKSCAKGFGLNKNNFLDMRININQKFRVIDWINIASKKELENVFFFLNNKNVIKQIIKKIIYYRNKNSIKTNQDLLNIIKNYNKEKSIIYKLFLFIKMFINNDYLSIKNFLKQCFNLLKKNGKLIIISFNSNEDIIIKNILNDSKTKYETLIIKPTILDLDKNYSSRSACMRIIIKN